MIPLSSLLHAVYLILRSNFAVFPNSSRLPVQHNVIPSCSPFERHLPQARATLCIEVAGLASKRGAEAATIAFLNDLISWVSIGLSWILPVTLQSDIFGNVIFLKSPLVERVGEVYRSHHHVAESGQYLSQTPPKLITIVQVTKKLSNKVYVTLIFPVHGNFLELRQIFSVLFLVY